MDFSLFYFSSKVDENGTSPYELLWQGAKFADENNFSAIWTPERHFDEFGAPFPSPVVTSAALAMITKNIQIRAGSVVLPLHNAVRVAEEWAMLDHFSNGRVGIAFASGWHARDFSLSTDNYANRKKIMLEQLEMIKKLWRQEGISLVDGNGVETQVNTYPVPVNKNIPVWFAASGSEETFLTAADNNVGILTHLFDQDLESLAEKIRLYRNRLKSNDFKTGHVVLMLHTFVGDDLEYAKNSAKPHLKSYLETAMKLESQQQRYMKNTDNMSVSQEDLDVILDYTIERFYKNKSLIGTVESCVPLVEKLEEIGVDEIACFIDFGIKHDIVMQNLSKLNSLKNRFF